MPELFEWPPTRSQRAKWVLEELGIDYSSNMINLPEGQENSDSYRAIHPLSVVPALKTDDYTIFESVAIVLQQIDEHPEMNLAPAVGTPERAYYYQWSVFACAELDPPIMMVFDNTLRPDVEHNSELAACGRNSFAIRAKALSNVLRDRQFLLGSDFCGADILIGHSCFMATFTGLLGEYPILESYFERLQKRPGYQRAYSI